MKVSNIRANRFWTSVLTMTRLKPPQPVIHQANPTLSYSQPPIVGPRNSLRAVDYFYNINALNISFSFNKATQGIY